MNSVKPEVEICQRKKIINSKLEKERERRRLSSDRQRESERERVWENHK